MLKEMMKRISSRLKDKKSSKTTRIDMQSVVDRIFEELEDKSLRKKGFYPENDLEDNLDYVFKTNNK